MISRSVIGLIFCSAFCVHGGSYGKFDVFKVDSNGQLNPVALNQDLVPNQQRNRYQNNPFFYGNNDKNQIPYLSRKNIPNNNRGDQLVIAVLDDTNNHYHSNFENQFNKVSNDKNNSPYEVVIIEEPFPQKTRNKNIDFHNTEETNNSQGNEKDFETILNENIDDVFGNVGQKENDNKQSDHHMGNFINKNQERLSEATTEYYSITIPNSNKGYNNNRNQHGHDQHQLGYNQYQQHGYNNPEGYNNNFSNQGAPSCNQFGCRPSPLPSSSPWGPPHGPHVPPPPHGPPPPYWPYPHGPPPHETPPHGPPLYWSAPGGQHHQQPQQWGRQPSSPQNPPAGGVNPLSSDTEPSGGTFTLITDEESSASKVEKGEHSSTTTNTLKSTITTSTMSTPYTPDIDVRFGRDDRILFPDD